MRGKTVIRKWKRKPHMLSLLGLSSCSLGHLQDAVVGHTQCFTWHPGARKWILKPKRLSHLFLLFFCSLTPWQRFVCGAAEARVAQRDPRAEKRGTAGRSEQGAGPGGAFRRSPFPWARRRLPKEPFPSPGRGAALSAASGAAARWPGGRRRARPLLRVRGAVRGAEPRRRGVASPSRRARAGSARGELPRRLSAASAPGSRQRRALTHGLHVNTLYRAGVGCWQQNQWQILQRFLLRSTSSPSDADFFGEALTLPVWNGSLWMKPATRQELGVRYF